MAIKRFFKVDLHMPRLACGCVLGNTTVHDESDPKADYSYQSIQRSPKCQRHARAMRASRSVRP